LEDFWAMTNEQCLCLIVYDRLRRDHHRAGPPVGRFSAAAREGMRTLLLEKSGSPAKIMRRFITPDCLNVFDRLGVREQMFDAGEGRRSMDAVAPDGRGVNVPMEWIADGHGQAIGISPRADGPDSARMRRARRS